MIEWKILPVKFVYFHYYMHSYRFIWLLLFLLTDAASQAQSNAYKLQIFGTRDGLISSKIFALKQAKDRKLWIGTEFGASVYDGYTFTNFQYSSSNEPIGRILCIAEDKEHGIWLGGDKGLFYLKNNKLQKITPGKGPAMAVEALHTDATGNVWIGDINALYKLSAATIAKLSGNEIISIHLIPYGAFAKRVFGLASDDEQNIYIASFDAVFKVHANRNSYEVFWKNPDPVQYVRSVAATSPDSIFWNCLNGLSLQKINGKLTQTASRNYITLQVFSSQQSAYALTTNGVGFIKDSINPKVSFGTKANNVVSAIVDEEENIWIASWEGLQKFKKTSFRQFQIQDEVNQEVFSFLERKNGELLFGSNRGKIFIKKENQVAPHPTIPPLFPLAEVMCLYEDTSAKLWAGSGYQGISSFKQGAPKRYLAGGFLKDNNCEALYARPDGKLFACTEQGVTLVDPNSQQPMVAHYPFQKIFTRYPELLGCFDNAAGNYWFYGSQGLFSLKNGLLIADEISGMPIKNLYITKIASDRNSNVWVATIGKGLLLCRNENGSLVLQKQYNISTGMGSDIALSVLVDKNNNVWWGDYMSVSTLTNPGKDEQLISFSESDGLISAYYQSLKLAQQKNGTIWGLTSMGIFSFDPDSIRKNSLAPVIILDQVQGSDSKRNFANTSYAKFTHDKNSFQFYFTAVSLTDPSKIRYAYRLIGLDSSWTFTSSRVAAFNFLQPGKYIFQLKAANNNNVWTEKLVQYNFSITPPIWQTWWFRLILAALILSLTLLLFRSRIMVIKHRATIKQKMAELEAKAIRAQMNPHFIFNSLNAIQESIVLNDYDTSYEYLSKFSKLLRLVLNNSDKNFIPLSNEIEMNRLYLELESLRFKHSFSYSIVIAEAIDADSTLFPSLLLQPFIENAVWHGLLQKDGEKVLLIHFYASNQELHCIIEDNGIGREKAAFIKRQKIGSQYFESKGTMLAMQRIQLLKDTGAINTELLIEDLKNEAGEATGTRIHIVIPLLK